MFTEQFRSGFRVAAGEGAPVATRVAAATLFAVIQLAAPGASAQPTIRVPDVSGDQLIFFYDNRTDRTSFLSFSNPSSQAVMVEVAFYPDTLAQRLGQEVVTLEAASNTVVDPTSAAGGVAAGKAGLAVVTPVDSADTRQPVVPPEPLVGNFTVANTALGAAFGENPFGRFAVGPSGELAPPGAPVDGTTVLYQRFAPEILMAPVYFNPQMLAPPSQDGNRIILVAFNDRYGQTFDIEPLSDTVQVTFFDTTGQLVAQDSVPVNGVLLSDLQALAGTVTLSSSGKVFFETGTSGDRANRFGLFSQSLGTFASGQRMPAVDLVPQAAPTPAQSATPGPTGTPAPTQISPQTITVTVGSGGSLSFGQANVTIHVGDTVHWVWGSSGHNVVSGTNGSADGKFCSNGDSNCGSAPLLASGATYDHTFDQAGSFPYFCAAHVSFGMVGMVTVMQ